MAEISVIIPVYNVEKYLEDCLDSVCNQSFEDMEIICVNDGSCDNSLDILNDYAKRDDRIKIISQPNQGLGAARNAGLSHANGNYIYFMDSDDYIELDTLEKLYSNALSNSSDMVLFKFQTVDDFKNVYKRGAAFKIDDNFVDVDYDNFTFTCKDVKNHVMNSAFSACLKLYKKEFADKINLTFPVGLHFEDVPVHVKAMIEAEKLSFVPESLYNYRSNPDSILNSSVNSFDIFSVIDLVEDYLTEKSYYEEFENEFIKFKIAQILQYFKTEKSDDYFNKTKEEFLKIKIKDDKNLGKNILDEYNRILSSNNYEDYINQTNRYHSKVKESPNSASKKLIRKLKSYMK